ncbi:MAG TPA: hypothetical protein VG759_22480 [Candidatus Angelobacter sp.]|jgi:hypothetical protein|nr:hypothetical protein [Candidatus Angelobacter sp.]
MLESLFREEAVEAYNERWLGEPLQHRHASSYILAGIDCTLIAILLSAIVFVSYSRHITISGTLVVRDGRVIAQAAIAPGQLTALHPGQQVALLVEGLGQFAGTVTRLAPASHQVTNSSVEIEVADSSLKNGSLLQQATGRTFSSSIVDRRRLYQWMFPSRSASAGRG